MMNLVSCTGKKQQGGADQPAVKPLYLLAGSYASAEEEGIQLYAFDQEAGELTYISGTKGVSNPSYLTLSASGNYVYAVSEDDEKTSAANVLSLDLRKGTIARLGSKLTQGAAPCYIALSPRQDFVVTANYNGGNISIFPLEDGGATLKEPEVIAFEGHGVDPERQEQPHLHCIGFSPDEQSLLAVDLGTDCIHILPMAGRNSGACTLSPDANDFDTPSFLTGRLSQAIQLPEGCGPRHLCFSSNMKYLYLITELSGDVLVMEYKGTDTQIIQTVKADTLGARGSADIHLTPDGRFLYASNRLKGDGIAIFKVDRATGRLEKVGYQSTGIHPRNFVISPNGKFLLTACRDTNEIQIYEIDQKTGVLNPTGKEIKMSKPTCLKFIFGR